MTDRIGADCLEIVVVEAYQHLPVYLRISGLDQRRYANNSEDNEDADGSDTCLQYGR
jgi:hypothetical protein